MRSAFYIVVFAMSAALTATAAWLAPKTLAVLQCKPSPEPDTFLAHCFHAKLGGYEHAAYALALEPSALAALKDAEVVVLGSSIAQMALSTRVTRQFFRQNGIRHYLFGFGHSEAATFPVRLLSKVGARPSLVIIFADPFFTDYISEPGKLVTATDARPLHFVPWRLASQLQGTLCNLWNCQSLQTLHRSRQDGHWIWANVLFPAQGEFRIDGDDRSTVPAALTAKTVESAKSVISQIGVPPRCVVLTRARYKTADYGPYIKALAEQLGAVSIAPAPEGLFTVDHYHLDLPSAERWSAAFLDELKPHIRHCVSMPVKEPDRPSS